MMDNVRALRHLVRVRMVEYARRHQGSYCAHMGAASVIWLLAGQPGLPLKDREERLNVAHDSVAAVLAENPDNTYLIEAHTAMHALLDMFQVKSEQTKADEEILAQYEQEFSEPDATVTAAEKTEEDPKE